MSKKNLHTAKVIVWRKLTKTVESQAGLERHESKLDLTKLSKAIRIKLSVFTRFFMVFLEVSTL